MGEHSLHVIRSAIALLDEMGIIFKQKNPGNGQNRTWQYKLNIDVLNRLLELGKCKTERATFNAEQYHRSHPEASKPQQHSAVELEKSEELENEILDYAEEPIHQTPEPELLQTNRFVNEQEQNDSTTETDHHEDNFSAAPVASNFCNEDFGDDDCAFERQEKSIQPSNQEVQQVLQSAATVTINTLYTPVSAQCRDSTYSQAVLGECAGSDRLLKGGDTDLERNQVTGSCIRCCL